MVRSRTRIVPKEERLRDFYKPDPSAKNAPGRPPIYNESHNDRAYYLCSKFGLTNEALANAFGVTIMAIEDWLRDKPMFLRSVRQGRWDFDSDRVVKSLVQRATGYTAKDEKIFLDDGEVIRVETEKHYPPDPTSMIFWLCNRQKHEWKREVKHELSGPDGGAIQSNVAHSGDVPLSVVLGDLSKDKLLALKGILGSLASNEES